jgi:hypothetical protein
LLEITEGEKNLIETPEQHFLLRVDLSLEKGNQTVNDNQKNKTSEGKKKGNRKPGVQNPKRNQIGIENAGIDISK